VVDGRLTDHPSLHGPVLHARAFPGTRPAGLGTPTLPFWTPWPLVEISAQVAWPRPEAQRRRSQDVRPL